ncbi:MAG TPA: Hsp20/alpha crystallin family protein, partial [Candidatus Paceibacterota bacterium]|nr:Hsp20/alpha crystallin family protein [Candidatus Paceibacterota bacterium]
MKKLSFFERLTGTIRMQDDESDEIHDLDQDLEPSLTGQHESKLSRLQKISSAEDDFDDNNDPDMESEAELAIDVFYNDREIVIQTMTAGIKKEHLEIILAREEITIRGRRDNPNTSYTNEFVVQELYWGPFGRTIQLPDEVAIDEATATEHHGLLTIKLPKFNKGRTVK